MSWSSYHTGTAEKVRAAVDVDLDRAIEQYKGTAEEADVRAAKASIHAALDAFKPNDYVNAVTVEACGSRFMSQSANGVNVGASMKVEIKTLKLDI